MSALSQMLYHTWLATEVDSYQVDSYLPGIQGMTIPSETNTVIFVPMIGVTCLVMSARILFLTRWGRAILCLSLK